MGNVGYGRHGQSRQCKILIDKFVTQFGYVIISSLPHSVCNNRAFNRKKHRQITSRKTNGSYFRGWGIAGRQSQKKIVSNPHHSDLGMPYRPRGDGRPCGLSKWDGGNLQKGQDPNDDWGGSSFDLNI